MSRRAFPMGREHRSPRKVHCDAHTEGPCVGTQANQLIARMLKFRLQRNVCYGTPVLHTCSFSLSLSGPQHQLGASALSTPPYLPVCSHGIIQRPRRSEPQAMSRKELDGDKPPPWQRGRCGGALLPSFPVWEETGFSRGRRRFLFRAILPSHPGRAYSIEMGLSFGRTPNDIEMREEFHQHWKHSIGDGGT